MFSLFRLVLYRKSVYNLTNDYATHARISLWKYLVDIAET
jgi:hypothetical protein